MPGTVREFKKGITLLARLLNALLVAVLLGLVAACGEPGQSSAPMCGESPSADSISVPDDAPRPGLREPSRDTSFGACLERVSDHLAHAHSEVVHTGARHQAWNADGRLLLMRSRQIILDDDSSVLTELPAASTPWVWDPQNANLLLAIRDRTLIRFDLASGAEESVLELSRFRSLVTSFGLAEPPSTERQLAVVGMTDSGGCEVVVVDAGAGSQRSIVHCPEDAVGRGRVPRYASVTPRADGCVIEWGVSGADRFEGAELYDLSGKFVSQLTPLSAAADLAVDEAGQQWLVYASQEPDSAGIFKVSLSERVPAPVELLALEPHQSASVACRAPGSGGCVVSTHGVDPARPHAFDEEVFRVSLASRATAPLVDRLAHHRSRPDFANAGVMDCQVAEEAVLPQASESRDGARVLFGSSWGSNCFAEMYWVNR